MVPFHFPSSCVFDTNTHTISLSGGWKLISPTWGEYVGAAPEPMRPVLEQFKSFVESSNLVGANAMAIDDQRGGICFTILVDSITWSLSFSFRGWGDFMAAVTEICEEMGYACYY